MITMKNAPKRLVFAGYAPVHFLCFLPMYRRLAADSRVEVFLSGGFREGKGDQATASASDNNGPSTEESADASATETAPRPIEHNGTLDITV